MRKSIFIALTCISITFTAHAADDAVNFDMNRVMDAQKNTSVSILAHDELSSTQGAIFRPSAHNPIICIFRPPRKPVSININSK